jgi:hypothetical protein
VAGDCCAGILVFLTSAAPTLEPVMMLFFSIFGELLAVDGFDFSPLLNTGVAAAVLAFLLIKLEPRLRGIESSIDRVTRALMIVVISLPEARRAERDQAQGIMDEIEKKKEK